MSALTLPAAGTHPCPPQDGRVCNRGLAQDALLTVFRCLQTTGLKIALAGVKRWQCPEIHAALQGSQPRYHPAWAEGPPVMNT